MTDEQNTPNRAEAERMGEAEVEGQGIRHGSPAEDVEGHPLRFGSDAEAPETTDVTDEEAGDDPDVEGHPVKWGSPTDEGQARR